MRAEELDTLATIETRTITIDSANGQQTESFAETGKIWLGRKYLSGTERVLSGADKGEENAEFWAHASDASSLTIASRIKIGAQYFEVIAPPDITVRGAATIRARVLSNG